MDWIGAIEHRLFALRPGLGLIDGLGTELRRVAIILHE